jgi:hypothetical protein
MTGRRNLDMNKIIKKQENGWYVVYIRSSQLGDLYQGAYKSIKTAQLNHPKAKLK